MKKTKTFFIILLIGLFVYYLVPLSASGMSNSDSSNFGSLCVYFVNSIYAIASGVILTKNNGFKWYYSFIVGVLFIPASLIYFNKTTVVYALLYVLEFMIGSSLYINYKN
jgi:hypothetical protein